MFDLGEMSKSDSPTFQKEGELEFAFSWVVLEGRNEVRADCRKEKGFAQC